MLGTFADFSRISDRYLSLSRIIAFASVILCSMNRTRRNPSPLWISKFVLLKFTSAVANGQFQPGSTIPTFKAKIPLWVQVVRKVASPVIWVGQIELFARYDPCHSAGWEDVRAAVVGFTFVYYLADRRIVGRLSYPLFTAVVDKSAGLNLIRSQNHVRCPI